jgi:hypothetical protein
MSEEDVIDADVNEEVSMEITDPERNCIGVRVQGIFTDVIGYLSDEKEGNRFVLENPAEIHYKKDEGAPEGQFKIVFVPCCPSSNGVLYIPYGNLNYIFDVKDDIRSEYEAKFRHTMTNVSKTPQYQG